MLHGMNKQPLDMVRYFPDQLSEVMGLIFIDLLFDSGVI